MSKLQAIGRCWFDRLSNLPDCAETEAACCQEEEPAAGSGFSSSLSGSAQHRPGNPCSVNRVESEVQLPASKRCHYKRLHVGALPPADGRCLVHRQLAGQLRHHFASSGSLGAQLAVPFGWC